MWKKLPRYENVSELTRVLFDEVGKNLLVFISRKLVDLKIQTRGKVRKFIQQESGEAFFKFDKMIN